MTSTIRSLNENVAVPWDMRKNILHPLVIHLKNEASEKTDAPDNVVTKCNLVRFRDFKLIDFKINSQFLDYLFQCLQVV